MNKKWAIAGLLGVAGIAALPAPFWKSAPSPPEIREVRLQRRSLFPGETPVMLITVAASPNAPCFVVPTLFVVGRSDLFRFTWEGPEDVEETPVKVFETTGQTEYLRLEAGETRTLAFPALGSPTTPGTYKLTVQARLDREGLLVVDRKLNLDCVTPEKATLVDDFRFRSGYRLCQVKDGGSFALVFFAYRDERPVLCVRLAQFPEAVNILKSAVA